MTRQEIIFELASNHFDTHGANLGPIQIVPLDVAIDWFNARETGGVDLISALALSFSTMDGTRRQRLGGMIEEMVQQRTIDGALNVIDELTTEIRIAAMAEMRPLLKLAIREMAAQATTADPAPHGMRPKDFDSSTL